MATSRIGESLTLDAARELRLRLKPQRDVELNGAIGLAREYDVLRCFEGASSSLGTADERHLSSALLGQAVEHKAVAQRSPIRVGSQPRVSCAISELVAEHGF